MTSAGGIHVFLWLVPPFYERLTAEHRGRRTRAVSLSVGQEAAWSPCPALGPAVQMRLPSSAHTPTTPTGWNTYYWENFTHSSTRMTALEARLWTKKTQPPPAPPQSR